MAQSGATQIEKPGRAKRTTRRSVIVADRMADWTIRIGGIGVIVAVFCIMAFLVEVVVPLFTGGTIEGRRELAVAPGAEAPIMARIDEFRTVGLVLGASGAVSAFHLATGKRIAAPGFDFGGAAMTSFARTNDGTNVAFGFADGSVRFGRLSMPVEVQPADGLPAGLIALDERDRSDGAAIYAPVPGGQVRKISIAVDLGPHLRVSDSGAPIVAMDYRLGGTVERPSKAYVTADAAGALRLSRTETRVNLLTRQVTETVRSSTLPPLPAGFRIARVAMTEKADEVYALEKSGVLIRFDTRDFAQPRLAERIELLAANVELGALAFLIGEQSMVVGGSDGSVNVWFRLQRAGAVSSDGYTMVKAKTLEPHSAPVRAIEPSQRGKIFVTASADGAVWVRQSTNEQTFLKLAPETRPRDIAQLALAPREDNVAAFDGSGRVAVWEISLPHPETTLQAVFGKLWYEGYPEPGFTWQSSSGTDSFEPKLSLIPLIFGTIKATIYSLLFAVPIALLAAIYTSEFLHHTVRATVKPVMEMMASLPSVVLGFIAALILAPFVETWLAAVLLAFLTVPFCLFLAAQLWQMLPPQTALRLQGFPKLAMMFLTIAIGVWIAVALARPFEWAFFAGDVRAWANGDAGSGAPFLALLGFPAMFLLVAAAFKHWFGERFLAVARSLSVTRAGALDLARWAGFIVVAAGLGYAFAAAMTGAGFDLRGGIVDTYVQRNTLVVGFAMGFAVIPIIYTIAEDALNSVPEHLRAASLACGATTWQTATAVILPTAVSGVFAAVMVGMGRAVGETMIVVMAAGNTPILDWNVFNGLRALSANIAVELPEAVKDGTLYRMLFLAALTLFVMTFVVNTAAEIIRLRFRRRAAQL